MLFLCVSDELSGILKKLSLEKYQPIFEEQEVFYLLCQRGIPKPSSNIKPVFLCFNTLCFTISQHEGNSYVFS